MNKGRYKSLDGIIYEVDLNEKMFKANTNNLNTIREEIKFLKELVQDKERDILMLERMNHDYLHTIEGFGKDIESDIEIIGGLLNENR